MKKIATVAFVISFVAGVMISWPKVHGAILNTCDLLLTKEVTELKSPEDALKITLSLDKQEWRKGNTVSARLRIENRSDHDIEMPGMAMFNLNDRLRHEAFYSFYSGVDLTVQSTDWVGSTTIKCPKRGHLDVSIDLGRVMWGRSIGAMRPDEELFKVVDPSEYELDFIFLGRESAPGKQTPKYVDIASNKVNVSIK